LQAKLEGLRSEYSEVRLHNHPNIENIAVAFAWKTFAIGLVVARQRKSGWDYR